MCCRIERGGGKDNEYQVEILLSTYNGSAFLDDLLSSLEKQTSQNWHLLYRDDGSADGTVEILNSWSNRNPGRAVRVQDAEGHVGAAGSFGVLLKSSAATYLMFCDQDDYWFPNKVELTMKKMREAEVRFGREIPILVHTDMEVVDISLNLIAHSFWHHSGLKPALATRLSRILLQNSISGCTVMINRALCDRGIPVPAGAVMHDWWLALIAAAFGQTIFITHSTVQYRQHPENRIGSRKYGISSGLKQARQMMGRTAAKASLDITTVQAKAFLIRFRSFLSREQCDIVQAYVDLPNQHFSKRKWNLFRYGFWKTGIFRNFVWIMWV
ncbi:MAG: glycosyltransferase family 2 protein [Holophagae bacterium]|nr:glycosyltransferase family 2 protein [Holophagae bacterium]